MIVRHSQVVLTFAKDSHEIRQTDRKLRKKFAGIRKKLGSIRNHLKGLTFSVILLGAVAGIRRKGLSDGLTLTRWRNAIFRVAGATN